MSQIIGFLEEMGRNPAFGCIQDAGYMAAVSSLQVTHAERRALLTRDHAALNDLLGGRQRMMCVVWQPPDESEHRQEDDEGADAPEMPPSPEKEEEPKGN